jgi:hypothetical protein
VTRKGFGPSFSNKPEFIMTTHFTIDTETLSKSPNGVVLSLSIVPFDFEEEGVTFKKLVKRGINLKMSVKEQVKTYKRKLCPETMDWWAKQDADARQILKALDTDLTVVETLEQFEESSKNWNERSAMKTSEIAGFSFRSWKNAQTVKGQSRQAMSVIDFGDVRFALPGTDLSVF